MKKIFFLSILFSAYSGYCYEIKDSNGAEIQVTDKNAVNAVDDIEMQENEALTAGQIEIVVKDVENKDKVTTDG